MSDFTIMLRYMCARAFHAVRSVPLKICRQIDFMRRGIHIATGSVIEPGAKIGRRTRINAASHIGQCEIGNYCAIGGRLVVRSSNHLTKMPNMQGFAQHKFLHAVEPVTGIDKGKVRIGHGVWIGDSVIVLPGASIGNGAVIGAGSVVTKRIPTFAIAAGNPAKVIRMRFSPAVCAALEELAWWDWDDARIARGRHFFEMSLDGIDETATLEKLKELAQ
jgi:acetyltransferase-like isoleucine patch superfamily enzyme